MENLFQQLFEFIQNELENEQSEIKKEISDYKKSLDLLDDCIFVDAIDELASYNVNLKQFDELLNKEELTESEEIYVSYLIGFTKSLIRKRIVDKIQEFTEMLDKF